MTVSHPSDARIIPGGRVIGTADMHVDINCDGPITVVAARCRHRSGRPDYHLTHAISAAELHPGESTIVTLDFQATDVLGTFSPTLCIECRDSRGGQFVVRLTWKVKVEDQGLRRAIAEGLGATSPYRRPPRRTEVAGNTYDGAEPGEPLPGSAHLKIKIPDQFRVTGEVWAGVVAPPGSDRSKALAAALAVAPTGDNYSDAFGSLLMAEEAQQRINIRNYDIEPASMGRTSAFLSLRVFGLAEGRPSVMKGDKIIAVDANGKYEGVVHVVELERVLLKFSERLMAQWLSFPGSGPIAFSRVEFTVNRTQTKLQHTGLDRAMRVGLMPCLHPRAFMSNVPRPVGTPLAPLASPPYNAALNEEQIVAVRAAMRRGLKVPYVIFGPPGTGKTSTLVELIKQIVSSPPAVTPRAPGPVSALSNIFGRNSSRSHTRVLVTAPSNAAVDNVVQRLLQGEGAQPSRVLRVNAFGRSREAVPPDILSRSIWNDREGTFAAPSRGEMHAAHVVAMTCMTAARYACSDDLAGGFDFVVIDEAGHATEPEAVSSIAGMLCTDGGTLVIAGDHKQLGPIVESPLARDRLGVSLLERLCASGPHAPLPDGEYDVDYATMLVRNYRSHPAIIEVPSRLFYHDRLVPCADPETIRSLCSWKGLANPGPEADFPILFHGIVGEDMREGNSPSWFNPVEAMAVLRHIESLQETRGSGFALDQVGVITPYQKQRQKLRKLLSARGMDAVRVGTTEEFQGDEKRVIIISLTRSTPEHVPFDARFHLGFVSNPKRFNVAVTRAQALLIIVGNPLLMAKDKCWGELLRLCVERGGYRGCDLPDDIFDDGSSNDDPTDGDDDASGAGAGTLVAAIDYGAEMAANRRGEE